MKSAAIALKSNQSYSSSRRWVASKAAIFWWIKSIKSPHRLIWKLAATQFLQKNGHSGRRWPKCVYFFKPLECPQPKSNPRWPKREVMILPIANVFVQPKSNVAREWINFQQPSYKTFQKSNMYGQKEWIRPGQIQFPEDNKKNS